MGETREESERKYGCPIGLMRAFLIAPFETLEHLIVFARCLLKRDTAAASIGGHAIPGRRAERPGRTHLTSAPPKLRCVGARGSRNAAHRTHFKRAQLPKGAAFHRSPRCDAT